MLSDRSHWIGVADCLLSTSVGRFGGWMGYLDAQQGAHARTAFRSAEKRYKRYKQNSTNLRSSKSRSKAPLTDLSDVLDFRKLEEDSIKHNFQLPGVSVVRSDFDRPIFAIDGHPGFYFISRALPLEQQLYWIQESLHSFLEPPNRTNHNASYGPLSNLWSNVLNKRCLVEVDDSSRGTIDDKEDKPTTDVLDGHRFEAGTTNARDTRKVLTSKKWCFRELDAVTSKSLAGNLIKFTSAEALLRKLRWATLGIPFDWGKKAYDASLPYNEIPPELAKLASRLAKPSMNGCEFRAEAAIVNYYGPDDMLGGHVDDMEHDWSKPIVSISLGCKAIFLIGGTTREEEPVAMFLRSGDVVLMAGPARQCFHGVPRIFVDPLESELPDFPRADQASIGPYIDYISKSRVNINVRQVH